jgi:predicted nuclease of predicted toxin-antitoxin system
VQSRLDLQSSKANICSFEQAVAFGIHDNVSTRLYLGEIESLECRAPLTEFDDMRDECLAIARQQVRMQRHVVHWSDHHRAGEMRRASLHPRLSRPKRHTIISKDADFADRSLLARAEARLIWVRVGNCRKSVLLEAFKNALTLTIQKTTISGRRRTGYKICYNLSQFTLAS